MSVMFNYNLNPLVYSCKFGGIFRNKAVMEDFTIVEFHQVYKMI
jgi:hypothetical protein